MSVESIPLTAWEQAVIVTLFAVIILVLAGGIFAFIRWVLKWAREREDAWQEFIADLRKDDVAIRREDQRRNTEATDEMQQVLVTMVTAMTTMNKSLEAHDLQAKEILVKVNHIDEQITKPLPRTRKAAGD